MTRTGTARILRLPEQASDYAEVLLEGEDANGPRVSRATVEVDSTTPEGLLELLSPEGGHDGGTYIAAKVRQGEVSISPGDWHRALDGRLRLEGAFSPRSGQALLRLRGGIHAARMSNDFRPMLPTERVRKLQSPWVVWSKQFGMSRCPYGRGGVLGVIGVGWS